MAWTPEQLEWLRKLPLAKIIKRKNGIVTVRCPFCHRKHTHGESDGPRVPHCATIDVSSEQKLKNGDYYIGEALP